MENIHKYELELRKYLVNELEKIEKKWQDIWEKEEAFVCENNSDKPKYYYLIEFPYPSGAGLHVGHVRSQTALDSMARKKRMQGFNVLYPIGWDSFGLPTEQYAIKNHIHPKIATKQNIETFKRQIKSLGISFDWSREFSTTDEDYYKWTQWQFLKFFEKGMAYKAEKEINWCPNCKIGLSNEESEGNVCERCGGKVEKKLKSQWMLKMSLYADKLLDGLSMTDFVDRVKTAQINWIGKSEGAEVLFKLKEVDDILKVFTTRPDTLFGVTFMVVSPEHEMLNKYKDLIKNIEEVKAYQEEAKKKMSKKRLVFATGNQGKVNEFRQMLGDDYEILSMKDIGVDIDIVEDGKTFEENAVIKAKAVMEETGEMVLADDSGFEVDYLNKEPGIYSARYLGEDTPYSIKNAEILKRCEGVPDEKRDARFVCVIACAYPDGTVDTATGIIEGKLAKEPKGENGFGYDPIFYLPERGMTTGEMEPEEKNAISHRGIAIRKMVEILKKRGEA